MSYALAWAAEGAVAADDGCTDAEVEAVPVDGLPAELTGAPVTAPEPDEQPVSPRPITALDTMKATMVDFMTRQ